MPFFLAKIKLSNPLAGMSRDDRRIVLICLGIAFFFWIIVKLSQPYQADKEVVLNFILPPDKALDVSPPALVPMRMTGTGWNLLFEFLAGNQLVLDYNLLDDDRFTLSESQLRSDIQRALSSGEIEITELTYDGLVMRLEEKAKKRIPILLRSRIGLANEHQLAEPPGLSVDTVTVSGPESVLSLLSEWPTDSLVLDNLRKERQIRLSLEKPPPGISLDPRQVTVHLRVEQYTQKVVWLPVEVKNPPRRDSLSIWPQLVKSNVTVGLSDYNSIHVDSFRLVADLEGVRLDEGKNTVPLRLERKPRSVRNVQLSNRSAEFYLIRKNSKPPDEN